MECSRATRKEIRRQSAKEISNQGFPLSFIGNQREKKLGITIMEFRYLSKDNNIENNKTKHQ